jgi:predicted MFS family arabinose efflux permease
MKSVPEDQGKAAASVSLASEYVVISAGIPLGAWLLPREAFVEWGSYPLICGLMILLIVFWLKELPVNKAKVLKKDKNLIKQSWWKKTKESFCTINWNLMLLNSSLGAIPLTFAMYGRYLPLYMPGMWSAWLQVIQTVTAALSGWLVIKVAKVWNKFQVVQMVHGIQIICLFLTWKFSNVAPIMVVSMLLLGFASTAFVLGFMQSRYEEAPPEAKGKQAKLNNLPAQISTPIGHWGSGPIVGQWGYGAVWWMIVPFHLFGLLAKRRFSRKTR